jgi:hypothetical protein
MNEQVMAAGIMLVNTLLQRAIQVSSRIQAGTLSQDFLDAQQIEDGEARERQIAALERALTEGR